MNPIRKLLINKQISDSIAIHPSLKIIVKVMFCTNVIWEASMQNHTIPFSMKIEYKN